MPTTLADALRIVADLPQEEQQVLFDYLADALAPTEHPRQPVQIAGALGISVEEDEGDPISDALAELRRERAAHFEDEWPS